MDQQDNKTIPHWTTELECDEKNGCVRFETEKKTVDSCTSHCATQENCIGCHFDQKKQRCVCYQDQGDKLLDNTFNEVLKESKKPKNGFGKRRIKISGEDDIPKKGSCMCGT